VPSGDDSGFQAWLDTMGYVLPAGAPSIAILRARGSAYLDATYEPHWTGQRADPFVQMNAWPRINATLNCSVAIPTDLTPPQVIAAAYRAAWIEASSPGALSPSPIVGARVKRQKVDVIEREFFDDGKAEAGTAAGFIDPEIDGAMRAFICADTGAGFLFESIGS
jgi:hypothetical protein